MAESASYPDKLPIVPLARPPCATVAVPGSKSITNRALVLAALTSHVRETFLQNVLDCEDTQLMQRALGELGFDLSEGPAIGEVRVRASSGRPDEGRIIPARSADLFVGNSGTTMRFLTAMVCLGRGRYRLDGVPRMRERPVEDLLVALRQLGAHARSETGNGCPPVVIEADGLPGGHVRIKGDVSSQFLSALLMACPFARGDTTVEVEGDLVSRPYVDMTVRMMHQWHLRVAEPAEGRFVIPGNQRPEGLRNNNYLIEPDASAASYFFAAAAITGGRVTVPGLAMHSLQGDVRFVDVLERMGCSVERDAGGITVRGAPLRGIDVGMSDISDTVMTLAAVACFAEGPTTIRNVAHIRHKETDRLAALAAELRRLGPEVEERADGLTIVPRPLRGAEVRTYNDHRMAMSLALVGLRVPGVVVDNPACVAKTYPGFFADLETLRC
jgi:3-phosphoshikimate 1-carboxyvinyltransferase